MILRASLLRGEADSRRMSAASFVEAAAVVEAQTFFRPTFWGRVV